MSKINELIVFKAKTKAIADHVNSNFEQLRLSNNEQEDLINQLQQNFNEYKDKPLIDIVCDTNTLELNNSTDTFSVSGISNIEQIIGITQGIAIIEFQSSRVLVNSNKLMLQNNVDKITKTGDVGIYLFSNDSVKEINYFTSIEEKTNSLPTQTIIDAPKNELGRSDFIKKVEFTENIMPLMEAFENEECVISSSSQYDATNYMPWKAFRHHNNDSQGWLTVNGNTTGWLKVEFRNKRPKITAFSITSRNTTDANLHAPCDFIIEGSNDDVNWTLLGDYYDNLNWLQNEKRYFALMFFDNFKYYRITITKNSGTQAYSGFGALEFYETKNDFLPMIASVDLSAQNPLLFNVAIGKSSIGKINRLSLINRSQSIENLYNNSLMYIGYKRNSNNEFEPFITTACPVYSNILQRHSEKNAIPLMISDTTTNEFKFGYFSSASSTYAGYPPYYAFNGIWNNKWMANIVGANQWLQIKFPNFRKAARFTIIGSHDDVGGGIKNAFIKGFNGEEWIVLKEIKDEPAWALNEVRHYDADIIEECNKFKLEITEIQNMGVRAQISQFIINEVSDCFVIPENKFYSYNIEQQQYEEQEIIYIGRIKTQNNFVSDVQCFAIDNKYTSEETDIAINSLYSFFHNIGVNYKNLKISAWIKDKVNGNILPWHVDSNVDYSGDANNYGYILDECQFNLRTVKKLMDYRDSGNTQRTIYDNVSFIVQVERSF